MGVIGILLASTIYSPKLFKTITNDDKIIMVLFVIFTIRATLMLSKSSNICMEGIRELVSMLKYKYGIMFFLQFMCFPYYIVNQVFIRL